MINPLHVLSLCLVASQIDENETPYVTITYGTAGRTESVRLVIPPAKDNADERDWARQILAAVTEAL